MTLIMDMKRQLDDLANKIRALEGKAGAGLDQSGLLPLTVNDYHIVDGAVTADKIGALAVTTAKIAADAVDKTKIAADVAGSGLGQNADGSLEVSPDGVGIQLTADTVALKDNYIWIQEEQTSGTSAGGASATTWHKRALNQEKSDTGGHASLASNQITLAAGTYRCRISAPAWMVDIHKLRLYNTTGSATVLVGTSEASVTGAWHSQTRSTLAGIFTIAAGQALEVQHYCQTAVATYGLGYASSTGETEVYTVAEFWRIA